MLAIRMRRMGSKKRPYFRLVVADSRSARDSRFVEVVGHYDPRTDPETVVIDRERLEHWIKRGARPSETVRTIVARHRAPAPAGPTGVETSAAPTSAPETEATSPSQ